MSGIGLILDLLKNNPDLCAKTLHSCGSFSAKVAVSAAAASYPFAFRAFLRNSAIPVAHCDAAPEWGDNEIPSAVYPPGFVVEPSYVKYAPKEYLVEPKPLLSAFQWRTFTMTTLRSFLMYYLPLLEPHTNLDEEDEDFLHETPEKKHVDLVTPFKKSVKQIARESTVVTTRRVLERLAVTYVSQRMAWKLLKDAPKSAVRKYQRGMPKVCYIYCVSRTTLRAHCLGVAASWIVQVGIETYRCLSHLFSAKDELEEVDSKKELQLLGQKVFGTTMRCCSSLLFASVGAGICATLIHPSAGQWIGCALGDLAGPVIITVCFDQVFHCKL